MLADVPDSYDVLAVFAERLAILPQRDDWPHIELDVSRADQRSHAR